MQDFRYNGCEIKLSHATNVPQDVLAAVSKEFGRFFKKGMRYRATGITLMNMQNASETQLDLFGATGGTGKLQKVFESVDALSEKYGKHVLFLGSSFKAMTHSAHLGERGDAASRTKTLFKGETFRKRLSIPYIGEVA